jgi:hypothetical protein
MYRPRYGAPLVDVDSLALHETDVHAREHELGTDLYGLAHVVGETEDGLPVLSRLRFVLRKTTHSGNVELAWYTEEEHAALEWAMRRHGDHRPGGVLVHEQWARAVVWDRQGPEHMIALVNRFGTHELDTIWRLGGSRALYECITTVEREGTPPLTARFANGVLRL